MPAAFTTAFVTHSNMSKCAVNWIFS